MTWSDQIERIVKDVRSAILESERHELQRICESMGGGLLFGPLQPASGTPTRFVSDRWIVGLELSRFAELSRLFWSRVSDRDRFAFRLYTVLTLNDQPVTVVGQVLGTEDIFPVGRDDVISLYEATGIAVQEPRRLSKLYEFIQTVERMSRIHCVARLRDPQLGDTGLMKELGWLGQRARTLLDDFSSPRVQEAARWLLLRVESELSSSDQPPLSAVLICEILGEPGEAVEFIERLVLTALLDEA